MQEPKDTVQCLVCPFPTSQVHEPPSTAEVAIWFPRELLPDVSSVQSTQEAVWNGMMAAEGSSKTMWRDYNEEAPSPGSDRLPLHAARRHCSKGARLF